MPVVFLPRYESAAARGGARPRRRGRLAHVLCTCGALGALVAAAQENAVTAPASVEPWDRFEVALRGPADGNPFAGVRLTAVFTDGARATEVAGFYDGGGVYRVRFRPERPGAFTLKRKDQDTFADATGRNIARPGRRSLAVQLRRIP
ncbi:MAG: DUF5060 domain-containing protein [Verrucomicrobia bacterium]|nr:DUF5060 domain-containing protein [Verrucomicrobiota bacterium]